MSTTGAAIAEVSPIATAFGVQPGAISQVNSGGGLPIVFDVEDQNGNPMAAGTTVGVTADSTVGTITGSGANWTIGCRTGGGPGGVPGYDQLGVTLNAATLAAGANNVSGNVYITVTSPGTKTQTTYTIPVEVIAPPPTT
jgi:hypothetical protein